MSLFFLALGLSFFMLWYYLGFFITLLIFLGGGALLGVCIALFGEISKSNHLKKQRALYLEQFTDVCTNWYNDWIINNKESSYQKIQLWQNTKTWKTDLTISYANKYFTQNNFSSLSSIFNSFGDMINTRKGLEYTVSVIYGDTYLIEADSSDYEDYEKDRCSIFIEIKKKG